MTEESKAEGETPMPHPTAVKLVNIFKLTDGFKSKYVEKIRKPKKDGYNNYTVNVLYESAQQVGAFGTVNLAVNEMGIGIITPLVYQSKDYLIEMLSSGMHLVRDQLILIRKYSILLNKTPKVSKPVSVKTVPKGRKRTPPVSRITK